MPLTTRLGAFRPLQSHSSTLHPHPIPHARFAVPCNVYNSIDAACSDLCDYCQLLDDQEASSCWQAYNYLQEQHSKAQHDIECGASSARMERLQQLVRQLMSAGDVRDLLYALQPLARLFAARDKCEQQGVVAPCGEAVDAVDNTMGAMDNVVQEGEDNSTSQQNTHQGVMFPGLQPTDNAQRITSKQKLLELFAAVDDDLNGRINASQFRGMCMCVHSCAAKNTSLSHAHVYTSSHAHAQLQWSSWVMPCMGRMWQPYLTHLTLTHMDRVWILRHSKTL